MTADLFDMDLRALRRDRALATRARAVPVRARVRRLPRPDRAGQPPVRSALLIGCPIAAGPIGFGLAVRSKSRSRAAVRRGGRRTLALRTGRSAPSSYDLCVAVGTLDTVNDLPLRAPTLLRRACDRRAADWRDGRRRHACPQLRARDARRRRGAGRGRRPTSIRGSRPSALAPLLAAAGFTMPVVDVDRVAVSLSLRSAELVARPARDGRDQYPQRSARAGRCRTARPRCGRGAFAAGGSTAATDGNLRNSPFRRLDAAAQTKDDAPLTLSAVRLVNPSRRKSATWTWTRGGWRGRYPKNFAQASLADKRGATAIEYGLIAALIVDRDDRRHAVAGRRRWRHVDRTRATRVQNTLRRAAAAQARRGP